MTTNLFNQRLKNALLEDKAASDLTTRLLPGYHKEIATAQLQAKSEGIFCGAFLLNGIFSHLDGAAKISIRKKDGAAVKPGDVIAQIRAKTGAILSGERVYLNLACRLSGIATLTNRYVNAVRGTRASILDTRKTTPLWRDAEKFAVVCGGGKNHRMSLGDAVLIKDNHLAYLTKKGITPAVIYGRDIIKSKKLKISFVEMEAKNIEEVWQAIKARVDIILLDNMNAPQIKRAMTMIEAARKALQSELPLVEVSGGITIEKAKEYAALGVDRISVGALTHSAPALDLSLEVI